jgi:hypothetical protein
MHEAKASMGGGGGADNLGLARLMPGEAQVIKLKLKIIVNLLILYIKLIQVIILNF